MIMDVLMEVVYALIFLIFLVIPDIPQFEITLLADLNNFVDLIFDNLGLLGFFVDIDTIKTLAPLLVLVLNFEHIYHFIIWCLNKIPLIKLD